MSPPKSQKIVVFGSIVQDLISYTERFPRPGESVRGTSFQLGSGGKGANQTVAAARLGADVTLISKVGSDIFAESNIKALRSADVNVDHVDKSATASTATATITVNAEGENSIVVNLGANMEVDAAMADRCEAVIAEAGIVATQAEVDPAGNRRAFELARKHGVTTFFNPAPGDANLDASILELVDIVCTNENEAEFITQIAPTDLVKAKEAAQKMLEMGPKHVIITLGPQGVLLGSQSGKFKHIPVAKVDVVDTTGAGDAFCGTFLALYVKGVGVEKAAETAATAATLSVQRKGTQSSYWKKQEIVEKYPDIAI